MTASDSTEDKWQPIETAPKGTHVLTWDCGTIGISWLAAAFDLFEMEGNPQPHQFGNDALVWYSERLEKPHEPTHWKPLPDIPEDVKAARDEFESALPGWWWMVMPHATEYVVTCGPHDDVDIVYTYRLPKPATDADALRYATKQVLAVTAQP